MSTDTACCEKITVIKPSKSWFDIDWKDLWEHRELLWLLVKRDISIIYKQTILGPVWFLIQPILTAIVFSVIFGRVGKIPTDGLPRILFYLSGLLLWNYFRGAVDGTANAFTHGKSLFTKVYFPRLIIPMTYPISHLAFFGWNAAILILFYLGYAIKGFDIHPSIWILLLPLLILYLALTALAIGLIIAALTVKYKDLKFAMPFILQIWMYSSPIIFSLRNVATGWIKWVLLLNPVTIAVEGFRFMVFGTGVVTWPSLCVSLFMMVTLLITGLGAYNKVQRNFVDTI